jgi:cell division protein FtsZ
MGGGTGTGGAPVVAKIAKEMGILTVAIVTTPFSFEGKRKFNQALEGIERLKEHVDTILVISNDKIREMFGNSPQSEAFNQANNILTTAAKSISEIITIPGYINVDFADVKHVMQNSGPALMGSATTEGEGRALNAIQGALNSPLLNDNDIRGAQKILVNISSGTEQITIDEITVINEYLQDVAKVDTDIIFGTCDDMTLGDKISVTIIATGFELFTAPAYAKVTNKVVHELVDKTTQPIAAQDSVKIQEPAVGQIVSPVVDEPAVSSSLVEEDLFILKATKEEEETFNLFTFQDTNEDTVSFDFEMESTINEISENAIEQKEEEEIIPSVSTKVEEEYVVRNAKHYETTPLETAKELQEKELVDRKKILHQLSTKSLNKSNLKEIESTPAYLRKNIEINNTLPSEERAISRFTLSNDVESDKPMFKRNNSFLEDNVD